MDANFWLMRQYRFRDLLDVLSNQRRNHDNNFYLLIAGYRCSTQEDCTRNKNAPLRSTSYVWDTLLSQILMLYKQSVVVPLRSPDCKSWAKGGDVR